MLLCHGLFKRSPYLINQHLICDWYLNEASQYQRYDKDNFESLTHGTKYVVSDYKDLISYGVDVPSEGTDSGGAFLFNDVGNEDMIRIQIGVSSSLTLRTSFWCDKEDSSLLIRTTCHPNYDEIQLCGDGDELSGRNGRWNFVYWNNTCGATTDAEAEETFTGSNWTIWLSQLKIQPSGSGERELGGCVGFEYIEVLADDATAPVPETTTSLTTSSTDATTEIPTTQFSTSVSTSSTEPTATISTDVASSSFEPTATTITEVTTTPLATAESTSLSAEITVTVSSDVSSSSFEPTAITTTEITTTQLDTNEPTSSSVTTITIFTEDASSSFEPTATTCNSKSTTEASTDGLEPTTSMSRKPTPVSSDPTAPQITETITSSNIVTPTTNTTARTVTSALVSTTLHASTVTLFSTSVEKTSISKTSQPSITEQASPKSSTVVLSSGSNIAATNDASTTEISPSTDAMEFSNPCGEHLCIMGLTVEQFIVVCLSAVILLLLILLFILFMQKRSKKTLFVKVISSPSGEDQNKRRNPTSRDPASYDIEMSDSVDQVKLKNSFHSEPSSSQMHRHVRIPMKSPQGREEWAGIPRVRQGIQDKREKKRNNWRERPELPRQGIRLIRPAGGFPRPNRLALRASTFHTQSSNKMNRFVRIQTPPLYRNYNSFPH
ncbi:hypothetical protein SK128_010302 [Halocaridina rubra]|uniref:Uncharacterized protein n=1 Tax=Halocaridina rubra TaxID=373956 RepID=A0AAN9A860_HALRR